MIALADNHGYVLSPLTIAPVNKTDMVLLADGLQDLKRVATAAGLEIKGATLNLDAGFDSKANRKHVFNAGLKPNIAENPRCALLFSWLSLERQIRIEGSAEKVARSLSEQYFKSRPKSSQIGATVSPQSQPVSRAFLEAETEKLNVEYANQANVPLPENWGGYRVAPTRIEFWQGRPSRLHDRICYTLQPDGRWTIARLAP